MYRLFCICVVAFVLTGCQTLNGRPGWLPSMLNDDTPYLQQLSPDKTIASGNDDDLDKDVRGMQSAGLGLVHHPELEQLLNDELQRIKDASGFTQTPGSVYILASHTMNAMTTADGNIYIPIGMLMDIQSLDEIDALLAHEFAHAVLAHTDTDIFQEIHKKGTSAYGLINRLGVGSDNVDQVSRRLRNSVALYMTTSQILNPTWTRKQETDADKLAIDFLVASGRNTDGMIALLSRVGEWDRINARLRESEKPKPSMLVAAATEQFAENEWQALLMQTLDPVGRQIEDGIAQTSKTHLNPQERLENVNIYIRQHYRRADRPKVNNKTWRKVAHSAKSKRIARGVEQLHAAYRSANQGNTRAARNALAKMKHRDVSSQTFYKLVSASVADAEGKSNDVMAIAQSASGNTYPSYRLQVMSQQAKARLSGQADEAELRSLYEEFDRYGRPVEFYYDLIELAEESQSTGLRLELAFRCKIAYFGNGDACSAPSVQSETPTDAGVVGGFLGLFSKN